MLSSYPEFFSKLFKDMQGGGSKMGILTARPADEEDAVLAALAKVGITPDFFIAKPQDFEASDGIFKGLVCKELGIGLLFDDFESSDPEMVADFFSVNQSTVPMTSWFYNPDHSYGHGD